MGWLTGIGSNLLGPWRIWAELAVVGSLVAWGGTQTWQKHSAEAGEAKAKQAQAEQLTAWQKQAADGEKAARLETEKNRAIEAQRVKDQQEAVDAAQKQALEARADAGAAVASHDSLLRRAQAAERASCHRQASVNPSAAQGSTPAEGTGLVLSHMLGRLDDVSGQLAAYADQARIAGNACVSAYDSLALKGTP